MTNRTKFIIGILVLLGIVFAIEFRTSPKFVWIPTFSHTDGQPFGCMLFDSVMHSSMPQGYSVTKKTVWQLQRDSTFKEPKSILVATEDPMGKEDVGELLALVQRGHTVLLAAKSLAVLCDTLHISSVFNSSAFNISKFAGKNIEKGALRWKGKRGNYRHYPLAVSAYAQLIPNTFEGNDSVVCDTLLAFSGYEAISQAIDGEGERPVALSFKRGRGELIIVSAPLLFTNYMTISGQGSLLQARLMDRLKAHPVIRMESYVSGTAMTESSLFYVMLKHPPLRWALYLTVLAVLLFCVFTARRRQRVIPVVRKPENRNLEFVRLIGSLYWQQHDNAGLLAKKLAYATEEIRRQNVRISAEDEQLLSEIREYAYGNYVIPDKTLKYYINELNRILQSL